MKIICMGDSITYGYGLTELSQRWTDLAAERTGHTLVNCGVNGDTTGGMLARCQNQVFAQSPDAMVLLGGINFSDWKWVLKPATDTTEAITINYGAFLSAVLDFFILAFVIFCMMKAINTLHDRMVKKAEATPPPPPPEPSAEEKLLAEIRDLLKEQQKK